jgi:hypothetical protein
MSENSEPAWYLTRDGDPVCRELFDRHYSRTRYADGRTPKLFVGPGEKVVLRTACGLAMWVWRKFIDDSGQQGVCCAVFRNETSHRSSDLVRQACRIADCLWPDTRRYTFVEASKVKSRNPGYCFLVAGWRRCGFTKRGLIVLELEATP